MTTYSCTLSLGGRLMKNNVSALTPDEAAEKFLHGLGFDVSQLKEFKKTKSRYTNNYILKGYGVISVMEFCTAGRSFYYVMR